MSTVAEDSSDIEDLPLECLEELRTSEKRDVHFLIANETDICNPKTIKFLNVQDFSNFDWLIGVLMYVMSNLR